MSSDTQRRVVHAHAVATQLRVQAAAIQSVSMLRPDPRAEALLKAAKLHADNATRIGKAP